MVIFSALVRSHPNKTKSTLLVASAPCLHATHTYSRQYCPWLKSSVPCAHQSICAHHPSAIGIAHHLCPLFVLQYASSFSPGSTDPAISPCMQYQRPTLADAAAPLNRTTCALLDKGSTRCRCYTHTPLTLRTLSLSHTHACRQSGRTGRCREPCSRCACRARQPPTRSRPGHAHAFS